MNRLVPGTLITWNDRKWVVEDFEDLQHVIISSADGTKDTRCILTSEIATAKASESKIFARHLLSEDNWRKALEVFSVIEPLTKKPKHFRVTVDVDKAAQTLNVTRQSIYNYLNRWEEHKRVSALARRPRADKGKPGARLSKAVLKIIEDAIEKFHLTQERPDLAATLEQVDTNCRLAGLKTPSRNTLQAIVARRGPREITKRRYGSKLARERFEPLRGSFPGADFPLAVVQIDHSPVDLIIVDEDRVPLKRCYLTVVIDVRTRMICGFCLSLEKPGHLNSMLALNHAMLPKDEWLRERGISAEWPIWGIPRLIHADNAKEFRGLALSRGCEEHNIILQNRPKGLPNYGGHIERLFRTIMRRVQRLPGTTFSNVATKMKYDSEGRAIFTLAELEVWFALFVVYVYHNHRHRSTGYPPINLYKKLILGGDDQPGIGLPEPIRDAHRLHLDFLPFFMGTVQRYGVRWEGRDYMADVLRSRVLVKDPDDPKKGRKFLFAYDPRNLDVIHFLDPDVNEYFEIPYVNSSRPSVSLWEVKAAKALQRDDPERKPNEEQIFEGIVKMREHEESVAQKSKNAKKARINNARRAEWRKAYPAKVAASENAHDNASSLSAESEPDNDDDIVPYDFDQPPAS